MNQFFRIGQPRPEGFSQHDTRHRNPVLYQRGLFGSALQGWFGVYDSGPAFFYFDGISKIRGF